MKSARRSNASSRRRRDAKTGGGFWRGVFLLLLGFTGGAGSAAYFAAYVNDLPLPLSPPPTRDADRPADESIERTRRETLEFHETLRRSRAAPIFAEDESDDANSDSPGDGADGAGAAAKQFTYYLQVGAFARRDAADAMRGELALAGARAEIRPGGAGAAFRVWAGPYSTAAAAEESRANLALQGYNRVQLLKLAERSDENEGNE